MTGFDTRVRVTCPQGGTSHWRLVSLRRRSVPFHRDGSRFYVRERNDFPDTDPPSMVVDVMRGELDDSGRVARGTISSRGVWGSGADAIACRGRASFSARGEAP